MKYELKVIGVDKELSSNSRWDSLTQAIKYALKFMQDDNIQSITINKLSEGISGARFGDVPGSPLAKNL